MGWGLGRRMLCGAAALVLMAAAGVFAPLVWLWLTLPIVGPGQAEPADAVLVFGALVRSGSISPLHAERLDTAVDLYRAGKVPVVVVSNASRAAEIMHDYLQEKGVPPSRIEVDGQAQSTPDTCVSEAARPEPRRVILLSQGYHLPRIALQCRRLGVTGQYVAAYRTGVEEDEALWTKVRVRVLRNAREAVLIWTELLGQYRVLERSWSP